MNRRKVTNVNIFGKDVDTETKNMVQYIPSTITFPRGKLYKCWWCTLDIQSEPIGCPINVSYSKTQQKIFSTKGIFCSFNCVKAYINEKERLDVMYKISHTLLAHMVCEMRGKMEPITINPSPDKCLLSMYGGHMNEEQYKHCLDRILYTEKGIVKMFPTTSIFQEEERLN